MSIKMSSAPSFVHGVDVGGTKIELVTYEQTGERSIREVSRKRINTPQNSFEEFVESMRLLVNEADQWTRGEKAAIGLGVPGSKDPETGYHICTNTPILNNKNLKEVLRIALGREVALANDSQCFTISEANGGVAHEYSSVLGVILGTGAGAGFCIRGELWHGRMGIAGEWGHTCVSGATLAKYNLPLFPCGCGLAGCRELYTSGTGLGLLYRHLGGGEEDAKNIADRAATGEGKARLALEWHLDILAQNLASLVVNFDPHVIVLGGGLSNLAYLYKRLPQSINTYLSLNMRSPPILKPKFGDAGGTRGAALLALFGQN